MKKVKILVNTEIDGKQIIPGEVIELDDHIADRLLKLRMGEYVEEPKEVYEPKTQFNVPSEEPSSKSKKSKRKKKP